MIGFPIILLDVLGDANRETATRQAAVIYLKNMISRAWDVADEDAETISMISEQDKVQLRSQIISRLVEVAEAIRLAELPNFFVFIVVRFQNTLERLRSIHVRRQKRVK